jgi:hemolysin D
MLNIKLRMQAAGDILRRYCAVFASAWRVRRNLETPIRLQHELAFLPASLELAETPVHPAPRLTMRIIAVLALLAVIIGIVGRLDIVASARGKLVPNARVKVVQTAVTAVVKRILVQDGQRVAAGELLMELDPAQAAADTGKAHSARIAAALTAARARALLAAQQEGKLPSVPVVEGATIDEHKDSQLFAEGVFRAYQDKQDSSLAELARREAELETTKHDIERLKATSPLARQQADDYKDLVPDKFVSRHDYLEREQSALQQEHELAAKISYADELQAAIKVQHAEIASLSSQFRKEQLDTLDKATLELQQTQDDETKATTRERLMTITAPVSGTVQQLSVHTLGGVVTAAQSLMEIVPDDSLEVEATVENKDIGFVKEGQETVVKIEAFPYTRYGYLHGTVRSVSNNAIQDKKQGLTFMTRIKLPTNKMLINGQWVNLTSGMAVTAEIKTGNRSVARYFLDPLIQTAQEGMRER